MNVRIKNIKLTGGIKQPTQPAETGRSTDIFDTTVLCDKCHKQMDKGVLHRNGFDIRFWQCPKCGTRIYHPQDIAEYNKFKQLKNKVFKVKLRVVGNSYTVSIPKEVVNFLQEQEKIFNQIANVCFEEAKKIALTFE